MKNLKESLNLICRVLFVLILIGSPVLTSCIKEIINENTTNPLQTNYHMGLVPTPSSVYAKIPYADEPLPSGTLPTSFLLGIPSIPFDQGQIGSCASCASSMAKSVLDHTKNSTPYPNNGIIYSPSFLFNQCHVDPNSCDAGSSPYSNLEILKNQGICKLSEMPYDKNNCSTLPSSAQISLASSHKIDHYFKIDPISISWIKEYIYAGLPVIIAFQIDNFFESATANSIWKGFGLVSRGYHCTMLYGWDDSKNAFKMLNSWGSGWGNNGTIWVDYNFLQSGSSIFYGKIFTEAYIIQNPAITNNSPVAQFSTSSSTSIIAGSSVSFIDQSSNNPTSWSWSFQGGTPSISTSKNPTIIYNNPGTYNVSLTVSNQSGSDSKTIQSYILVNQLVQIPVAQFSVNSTTITAGSSVSFTDQSANTPTAWSWSFPGGTPSSSNLKNPTVVYSNPGVFSVTLNASNQSGASAKTLTNYIQVNQSVQTPVADFTANSTTIAAGSSVTFSDQSTNTPTAWSWSFSGGTPSTSNLKNPTVIYSNPGVFSVTLNASNQSGAGAKTLTNYIQVNQAIQAPVAQFAASSSTTITAGSSVSFVDQSTNTPTFWSWSFPGGTPSTSTLKNPTIIYNSPGIYNVSLTVSNQSGSDSKTLQSYILVNQLIQTPVAQFAASGSTTISAGSSVSFVDQSTNTPTSWLWSFPSGTPSTSTSKNPTVIYNNPGTYNVSLTVSNQSGSDSKTLQSYILVNQLIQTPVAKFAASGSTTISAGSSVSFVDQSTNNPTSWSWGFPGGTPSTSTSKNPTIIYNSPGIYNVSLTVSNQSGSDSKTLQTYILVNQSVQMPVAQFTAGSNTTITAGSSVSFVDQSTNTPTSWSWSFPGGTPSTSNSKNPTIIYNNPGTYNVSLKVSNQSGSDSKTLQSYILVNQLIQTPVAQFAASGSTTITAGSSVSFVDQSTNTPTSWSWSFPGGTPSFSNLKNPTVIYNNPGNYNVNLTVYNQSGSNSLGRSEYILVTSNQINICGQPFKDVRDGNTYATVSIGSQCWMAEDSRFASPKSLLWNGHRYYEYSDAINIAPAGWHLPSDKEWQTLEIFLGINPTEANSDGWRGTDQGYTVRAGGSSGLNLNLNGAAYLDSNNRIVFSGFNGGGCYWTSTKYFNNSPSINSYMTIGRLVNLTVPAQIYRFNSDVVNNFYSVRFIRD